MHTVNILKHLVENYEVLVYVFIFIGLIIEGEFVLISTGILLHLDAINIPLTFTLILLGVLCKTFLGYYVGSLVHRKWNHTRFLKLIERQVLKVMPNFEQKPFWSIFISKFILGVNNIVIIFAGYKKINFKKYLKAEFSSTALFAPALILIGYLFSYTAIHVSREIWRFSFTVLLMVVLFIIFDRIVGRLYELFEEVYNEKE